MCTRPSPKNTRQARTRSRIASDAAIKSTAIDPSLVDEKNVYRHLGPARVYISEASAIQAIKSGQIAPGDVIVLICGGLLGAGIQEIYQITSALKQLPHCKDVAVLTDARFSGVSTGACIGHISPEALAGGPIDKIQDGDRIEIVIDRETLTGSLHLVGDAEAIFGAEEGGLRLAQRKPRADLRPHPCCPTTRVSGPHWCRPAEAFGVAASMTSTRSFLFWSGNHEALP